MPRSALSASWQRSRLVAWIDLRESLRRPLLWFWVALMGFNAWLMSRDAWIFRSVDTSLGSPRAWANSEFQVAFVLPLLGFLLVSFFVTVVAGMPLIRDAERKVGELLAATRLTAGEYVWGKFLAALGACLAVFVVFAALLVLFIHGAPDLEHPESYGPFAAAAYWRPFLLLFVPGLVFVAGAAFWLGQVSRRPIVVFLLPVVLLPFLQNFVWRWFPPDLSPTAGTLLRYLDPSGFRWLKETWLRVDRGISFYNTQPIHYGAAFVGSRVAWITAGLLLVALAQRSFARRGRQPASGRRAPEPAAATAPGTLAALGELGMRSHVPGWFAGALNVVRFELSELLRQPSLYIFIPAIALFFFIDAQAVSGEFNFPVLLSSGNAAIEGLTILTAWLTLLLLFTTVESFERERSTGAAPVLHATPVDTSALVAGKLAANLGVVGAAMAVTVFIAWRLIAHQGTLPFSLWPFVLVWGGLLLPTLLAWMVFVTALYALTDDRYLTYGIGLAVLITTVALDFTDHINWVGNWLLLQAVRWSDMGTFELDGTALWLNRLALLGLIPPLFALAVACLHRRQADALGGIRRRPVRRALFRRVGLLLVPPVALLLWLGALVGEGFEGGHTRRLHKQYWQQNVTTWRDAPMPFITSVDLDIGLEPEQRHFTVAGAYTLVNRKAEALPWFAMTGGIGWQHLNWTVDGQPYRPEEREERNGLFVFPRALAPGTTLRLGFVYDSVFLPGISRRGGSLELGEFILPSGVLVTGRNPDFLPVLGFQPAIGIDDGNQHEPRRYPSDFWRHELESSLDRSAFASRVRITAPADYTVNSVGHLENQTLAQGRRTWLWTSDAPLRVINIAAGKWAVRRGAGTAVFYHPGHEANVGSLLAALDGARRYYDAWFYPYPWRELRLNEFPAVSNYARGNATNIFFSESLGFLAEPGNVPDWPFTIAAHEAAHQWWGHILPPGQGPGGIVLAEGAAHFSTMLLLDQVKGPAARIAFATRIETNYGENREPSTEKPLAETTPFRPADTTVIYDKGGWAFWMLLEQMGRDAFFAGAHAFIGKYHAGPGYPVLQNFIAAMRPYARDPVGFDAVASQWFFQRVVPEYRIVAARRERTATGWAVVARVANAGTARMPIEVAAASQRERFDEHGQPVPAYRDARVILDLAPGAELEARIPCAFEPHELVIDPDARVLQLQRQAARQRLQ